jgi:type VI secretion system VgrG family protein
MSYFADLDSKRFSFVSKAMGMDEQTFAVINFKGYESISKPYEFDILLVSNEMELDLGDVLNASAQFLIHRGGDAGKDDVLFNGVLASFEQLQEFNGNVIYRAKLVPKLWWLSLTKHNQVFLDDNVPELVRLCLEDADLLESDYDFSGITGDYQPHEYVCQYGETHFTFVSRWLEREGIYYYFSQEDDGEIIQFSDANTTAETLDDADLFYSPESGLESTHLSEVIRALTCRQKQLPKEVILKDYNYEKPSLDVTGRAAVDPGKGRGNHYVYGEHFPTPEEGDRLALIRAEELLCQQKEFYGESTVPFMNPGYTFNLLNHYRGDYNQEYLVLEVTHEGSQTACLTPEIVGGLDKPDEKVAYANSFKAIPSITQFRPERTTERPRISGTLNAKIDAEGDGEYAELDEQGRYKVKLPFDVNDQIMDGKASARVRMMQPYAGKNKGMQFTLNKGTEVLLSFIDGHPDRPIIAGAVNNPETPGVVNANNQTESQIKTGGNNKIRFGDQVGSERVVLESSSSSSWVRIGSHNDPITINGSSSARHYIDTQYTDAGARFRLKNIDGSTNKTPKEYVNLKPTLFKRPSSILRETYTDNLPLDEIGTWIFYFEHIGLNGIAEEVSRKINVTYEDKDTDTDTDTDTTIDQDPGEGIKINTAAGFALEANGSFAVYIGPASTAEELGLYAEEPTDLGKIRAKFRSNYTPSGLLNMDKTSVSPDSITTVMTNAKTSLSSIDTVTTQEGNIYDFGGYWNYNLGNCYIENWIVQNESATLNCKKSTDLLGVINITDGSISNGPYWIEVEWPEEKTYLKASQNHGKIIDVRSEPGLLKIHSDGDFGGLADAVSVSTGGSSIDESHTTLINSAVSGYNESDFENGKLWVEKKYGHSYDFHEGAAISVSKGSTLDIMHGGRHIEVAYRGDGSISSWSRSESGVSEEKKWTPKGKVILDSKTIDTGVQISSDEKKFDRNTGDLFTHEISSTTGMGTASFAFNFANTASCSISTGTSASIDIAVAAKLGVEIVGGISIDLSAGLGLKGEFKFPVGGFAEIKHDEAGFSLFGLKAQKAAAVEAKQETLVLTQLTTQLQKRAVTLEATDVAARKYSMQVMIGNMVFV